MEPRYYSRRQNKQQQAKSGRHMKISYARLAIAIFVGSLAYLVATPPLHAAMAGFGAKQQAPAIKPASDIPVIIARYDNLRVGVAIEDIPTGEAAVYGSTEQFDAASTGKVIMAAACMDAA